MNLKLYALKKGNQQSDTCIQLVVVDLDKSKRYPLNYVCILPRYFRLLEKRSSQFVKIFGTKSINLAKRLLLDAEQTEEDPQIKKVIDKRIKEIDSQQES
jgi:hypothetical protein